ncbi:MAG: adaptor protein MecA [Eubacteriales bacterium]|nr:adaptor protein MecA [Eubacteriales bacterium]
MKIESIEGNRKVRVLLTQNDLSEMNISLRTLTSDSPELSDFLYKIMDYINHETGFNAKSGQIVIEASPADGGVILTVTKITPTKKRVNPKIKSVKVKNKEASVKIYQFATFENLSEYLSIANSDMFSNTKLYSYNSSFYLIMTNTDSKILEFADKLSPFGVDEVFFNEHGNLIAESEVLANMASELKKLK